MTNPEKLKALKLMVDEQDEELLSTYLSLAATKILEKCYPYGGSYHVPQKYEMTQLEIAAYLINKRGAEGQTSHSEGGINRSYEAAGVPDSMLRGVIPFVKPIGG